MDGLDLLPKRKSSSWMENSKAKISTLKNWLSSYRQPIFLLLLLSFIAGCKTISNMSVAMYHPIEPLSFKGSKAEIAEELKIEVTSKLGLFLGHGTYKDYSGNYIYNEPLYLDRSPKEIVQERFNGYAAENPEVAKKISSCHVDLFAASYNFEGLSFVAKANIQFSIKLKNEKELKVFSEKKDSSVKASDAISKPSTANARKVINSLEKAIAACLDQISKELES